MFEIPIWEKYALSIEEAADYFGIGCICKKDSFGMEYVKTSFRARAVIKHTFLLDMCFGVLRNLLFYLTCLVYMVDRSSNISILVVTFLLINIFYILLCL